jgi:hypothetical protein
MPFATAFSAMPSSALSWASWFVIATVVLYFMRAPAKRAILSLTRVLHHALRLAATSVMQTESRLEQRNREVLLAAGREASERIIEREFERVEAAIQRDLAECPGLYRKVKEEITHIDEDHRQSIEVPPTPPSWVDAVQAVAQIPDKGDSMVGKILEQIHGSLIKALEQATQQYRAAIADRHKHLKAMMPHWRNLLQLIDRVDRNVNSLLARAKVIDRHIEEYEGIQKQTDRAVRTLSSSSLNQFFISGLVLAIAIGGALINFQLIARPMAEMVGGNSLIGGFKTSNVAALVIILVEISMGLFLMESMRITRLFPVIGALPDKLRIRMMWVTFAILFMLASVEAGLAYMREILLQDTLATSAVLRGESGAAFASEFVWITTAAQMGLGFILPFALVFVAIPLETFVQSLRTVLGFAAAGILRALAVTLRVLGNFIRYTGEWLADLYDLFIFAPLWLERQVKSHVGGERKAAEAATAREAL